MCSRERACADGNSKFFRVSLSHDNLMNHYQTNFAMMQHHKYSLSELNEMMPWEREIYVALLVEHIKEENDKAKKQEAQQKSAMSRSAPTKAYSAPRVSMPRAR